MRPWSGGTGLGAGAHLKVGDIIVAGAEMGRVRALINAPGRTIDDRPLCTGRGARLQRPAGSWRPHGRWFENKPAPVRSPATAPTRARNAGLPRFPACAVARADDVAAQDPRAQGFSADRPGDVQGSLEAILGSLEKLGTEEVAARICMPASAAYRIRRDAGGRLQCRDHRFNVRGHKEPRPPPNATASEIRYYKHHLRTRRRREEGDERPAGADGLRETMLGNALILEVFKHFQGRQVAGCRVTDGTVNAAPMFPPDPRQRRGARRQAGHAERLQGR